MGGAGFVILFVVSLVGFGIWTTIYLTFAAHYFLTIVSESGAGIDEIEFPSEGVADWWWKPFFCVWILTIWVVPIAVLAGPLLAASPLAFLIGLAALLMILYPLSILSTLYSQSWLSLLHPELVWRLLRRFGCFAYVQFLSFLSIAVCIGMLAGMLGHSYFWALPASFVLPTALLLYARHWGRYSWLALNFLPGDAKKPRQKRTKEASAPAIESVADEAPEMDVQEIDPHAEGIAIGLPPMFPTAVQASESVAQPNANAAISEEEDEWATEKAPYGVIEGAKPEPQASIPAYDREPIADADKPMSLSKYYEEQARKEKKRKAARENTDRRMPSATKKAPLFQEALLRGVWEFMIYGRTLRIWGNLVVLTAVELLFLFMVKQFWPRLDG